MAPLPPLPPNNTTRVMIDYTSGLVAHSLEFRIGSSNATQATDKANIIITAMRALMSTTDSIVGARWVPAGENISQNLPITGGAGQVAGLVNDAEARACFYSFVGRSNGGRKTRVTFFTLRYSSEQQYRRAYAQMDTQNQALYNAVTNQSITSLVAVDGQVALWKPYANIGQNAHWQRASR